MFRCREFPLGFLYLTLLIRHKAVIGEVMNPLQKRSGEVGVKLIISLKNPILDMTLLGVDDDMGHMNHQLMNGT